jgi:hypothetical protein
MLVFQKYIAIIFNDFDLFFLLYQKIDLRIFRFYGEYQMIDVFLNG